MRRTHTTQTAPVLGRQAAAIAEIIRKRIAATEFPGGTFLPSIRELATQYARNGRTIHRALRVLEQDGALESVDRRGYRVLDQPDTKASRCLVAYVPNDDPQSSAWRLPAELLLNSLRNALNRRHWPLVAIGSRGRAVRDIIGELTALRVSAVVLDSNPPEWIHAFLEMRAGMQVIVADDWPLGIEVDSVMQDGQMGCMLAVDHLVQKGCRRIGWFGTNYSSAHAADRYSGMVARLQQRGLPLNPNCILRTNDESVEEAIAFLRRKGGPDGVIAPWLSHSAVLVAAAQELRLPLGKTFHVVSWCPDSAVDNHYRATFRNGTLPPAITWSPATMAEVVVQRLGERIRNPNLSCLRIKLPVKLTIPS